MAELLKNQFFQPSFIEELGYQVNKHWNRFDTKAFQAGVLDQQWDSLELKGRMGHIADKLFHHLPAEFPKAIEILSKTAPNFSGFDAMVFPDFVGKYGLDHWEASMNALELFTQYSSGEFAIRPFLIRHQGNTMKKMLSWSKHENQHVRRLSSEGCRPRLPWAMALPQFKQDPAPIFPILENLKADHSTYVRKSVANNLNDISKDNPATMLALCKNWIKGPKETQWIIKHGLRSLVKKGSPSALEILGFKPVDIQLEKFTLSPKRIKLGESIRLKFDLVNHSKSCANVVVDYIVHFKKANGSNTPKVFKLTSLEMGTNTRHRFTRDHKIVPITTRTYYSGEQRVEIQVNGEVLGSKAFKLTV